MSTYKINKIVVNNLTVTNCTDFSVGLFELAETISINGLIL